MSNTTIYAKMEKIDSGLKKGARISNGVLIRRKHRQLLFEMFNKYRTVQDVSNLIRPKKYLTNGDRKNEEKVISVVGGISGIREGAAIVKDAVVEANAEVKQTEENIHSIRGSLVVAEKSFKELLGYCKVPIAIAGVACVFGSIIGFAQEKWGIMAVSLGGLSLMAASYVALDYFFNVKAAKINEAVQKVKDNLAELHTNLKELISETEA